MSRADGAEDEEEFVGATAVGMDFEGRGGGEVGGAEAVGDGGGGAAAEDAGAEGEMNFIDEVFAEEGVVEFAAAFTEEPLDAPFGVEPTEGAGEIDFLFAADFHGVGGGAEGAQARRAGGARGEDEERGEMVAENFGVEIHAAGAGDDDAEAEFSKAGAATAALVLCAAGAE